MMNQAELDTSDESIDFGPNNAFRGSGGTGGGGAGPVAPSGSNQQPEAVLSGFDNMDTGVQVNFYLNNCCTRSKNANGDTCGCTKGGTSPGSNISKVNSSLSECGAKDDTDIQNQSTNSRMDDFDSTYDDAQSVSLLDKTGFDNSKVNYGDITYVEIPEEFNNININTNSNSYIKDKGEKVKESHDDENEDPKKKRLNNSERRWRKKCKIEEERGKEIRDKNKGKPMTDLQAKINEAYKKKISYAQCVKTHEMLEVRSSDSDVMLDQADFDKIDRELLYRYAGMEINDDDENVDEENGDEDIDEENLNKNFYGLVGGISQGCCWLACDNEETAAFVKLNVPQILPPSPYTDKYKYIVYSASQKPYRYMKCKVPKKFWDTKKRLQFCFKASNPCLRQRFPDAANPGKTKVAHFKITAGCFDKAAEMIDDKFFWVQVEIDEQLMPILTGSEMRGGLKLGASPINLIGGGIVSETKKNIEKELTQHLGDLNSEELRG